jgi:hypothetical protein
MAPVLRAAVRVERVVHGELARHVVEIVAADGLKARGGGVETGGLRRESPVVGIGAPDHGGERRQRGIGKLIPIDEGVEGAKRTPMPQLDGGHVVRDRVLTLGRGQHLGGGHEQELRLGVDEAGDEPGARDAIDTGPFASDPFHDGLLA